MVQNSRRSARNAAATLSRCEFCRRVSLVDDEPEGRYDAGSVELPQEPRPGACRTTSIDFARAYSVSISVYIHVYRPATEGFCRWVSRESLVLRPLSCSRRPTRGETSLRDLCPAVSAPTLQVKQLGSQGNLLICSEKMSPESCSVQRRATVDRASATAQRKLTCCLTADGQIHSRMFGCIVCIAA